MEPADLKYAAIYKTLGTKGIVTGKVSRWLKKDARMTGK
jgi:hypothetical protein